ncbi:MAG TPA: hypothetical protein EYN66_11110, partial [Myxococcales bacterium]|nr:hypothetical protein [Myxococcales bacterium]
MKAKLLVLVLVGLTFTQAQAKKGERSVALIFEPARASDAEKVAQLRLLLAQSFKNRHMAIKRFLVSFDESSLDRAVEKLKAAKRIIAQDANLKQVPQAEYLLTQARYGFLSSLGEVTVSDLSDAHLGLALTRLSTGDRRLATGYMDTTLHLNPAVSESRFRISNDFLNLYRERRGSIAAAERGHAKITSSPN